MSAEGSGKQGKQGKKTQIVGGEMFFPTTPDLQETVYFTPAPQGHHNNRSENTIVRVLPEFRCAAEIRHVHTESFIRHPAVSKIRCEPSGGGRRSVPNTLYNTAHRFVDEIDRSIVCGDHLPDRRQHHRPSS